MREDTNKP